MDNWQPIKTAPKDGTEVLLSSSDGILVAFWSEVGGYWATPRRKGEAEWVPAPSHWMSLPEPPTKEK